MNLAGNACLFAVGIGAGLIGRTGPEEESLKQRFYQRVGNPF